MCDKGALVAAKVQAEVGEYLDHHLPISLAERMPTSMVKSPTSMPALHLH
jgi:hypothetical protein